MTRAHLLVNPLRSVFLIYHHGGIYRIISMVDYAIYTTMVEYEKYTTCALYWDAHTLGYIIGMSSGKHVTCD